MLKLTVNTDRKRSGSRVNFTFGFENRKRHTTITSTALFTLSVGIFSIKLLCYMTELNAEYALLFKLTFVLHL